jgi:hypothetical protein
LRRERTSFHSKKKKNSFGESAKIVFLNVLGIGAGGDDGRMRFNYARMCYVLRKERFNSYVRMCVHVCATYIYIMCTVYAVVLGMGEVQLCAYCMC